MEFHPIAEIFPLIEGTEFNDLVDDIRENGLHEPIVLYDGKILDGRNRYRACEAARAECRFEYYTGADPLSYVISLNLKRRHLNESQRAMVAARIANLAVGSNQYAARTRHDKFEASANLRTLPAGEAKSLLNVSARSIETARTVQREGVAELVDAVDQGKVSVSAASDVASLPHSQQREIVARGEREILDAAKAIRAEKADVRRTERIERIESIAAGNTPLLTPRKYPIIYADPPWKYENPPVGDTNRSIENHYPTMDLDEICALRVASISADDALLYLWATAPKLPECLKVMEAWGFEYRTHLVWVKDKIGMGYHARSQHELLLIGKRGQMPPPRPGEQPSSVIEAPRGEHSEKPPIFAEMIERLYPEVGKIELFSRSPRSGWDAWGNQVSAA